MSNCASCVHWRPLAFAAPGDEDGIDAEHQSSDTSLPDTAWNARDAIRQESPPGIAWGWCSRIDIGDAASTAFVMDGSEYAAHLWCRAEFGCVLHERKPPAR